MNEVACFRSPLGGANFGHMSELAGEGEPQIRELPLLGNGQTGIPTISAHPSGKMPWDDSVTPLIKGLPMNPIPSHPHGQTLCSEEVVACSSELTVDDDGAARTVEELVTDA